MKQDVPLERGTVVPLQTPQGAFDSAKDARVSDRTRDKLIEAAGRVFAEKGYQGATVREICRQAGANVASVNYTFGDKLGLYTEVLRQSVRAAQGAALSAALTSEVPPEQVIRSVITLRLRSLCSEGRPDWHFRIVMHEFAQPTPAMTRVIDEGMRPIYDRMRVAVGAMIGLPPDHEKTRLCINSIIGQVLFYTCSQPVLARLQPDLTMTSPTLDRIAEHIYEFSMAYLRKVRAQRQPVRNAHAGGSSNGRKKSNSARAGREHR